MNEYGYLDSKNLLQKTACILFRSTTYSSSGMLQAFSGLLVLALTICWEFSIVAVDNDVAGLGPSKQYATEPSSRSVDQRNAVRKSVGCADIVLGDWRAAGGRCKKKTPPISEGLRGVDKSYLSKCFVHSTLSLSLDHTFLWGYKNFSTTYLVPP